uniref:Uncharacterized protein n=1 Tax=Cacopsylla melanoneura TaxID=428564 RepID=A0A8D8ZBP0_9HEMI
MITVGVRIMCHSLLFSRRCLLRKEFRLVYAQDLFIGFYQYGHSSTGHMCVGSNILVKYTLVAKSSYKKHFLDCSSIWLSSTVKSKSTSHFLRILLSDIHF